MTRQPFGFHSLQVLLVTPATAGSRTGNRITAIRWAVLLRELGHRVRIVDKYYGHRCDLLIALHALKSHDSVKRFRREHPGRPIFVALTGTDLYQDIHKSAKARLSLEWADRLILLQERGIEELPDSTRDKARVIHQSAPPLAFKPKRRRDLFEICVLGHLRPVKDPFRTARAARLLPADSRIRVIQVGSALSSAMAAQANAEEAANPRYQWLGELSKAKAIRRLADCKLLSLTSISEGGANVISEAVTAGVPIVASRIAGSIGLLGDDYPGYFPVGDTKALAALLYRAETDRGFYRQLAQKCNRLKRMFDPKVEKGAWKNLLKELCKNHS